ncbi:MAG: YitT family protein [Clostridia bacterium]
MKIVTRVIQLFLGLFLFAVGIVMTINANFGLAPWDVFHQGISAKTNITLGQVSIIAGIILIIINSFLGERTGWGTLANMLFVGLFLDFLMLNKFIPTFTHELPRFLMLLAGMFIIGVGSYFYLRVGLGSGPRDGLMIALTKKTQKSVGFIRNVIESGVLILGYLLGGYIGIGTLVVALTIGYFIQFAFKIFHFNVSEVKHRFIDEDIKWLLRRLVKSGKTKTDSP